MTLTKGLEFNVVTGKLIEVEIEIEFPNPRIQEIQDRLQEITQILKINDYKTLKYIEGDLSEEDFIVHKTLKNDLRTEYNTLEEELNNLV